jgi:hypothetical protein
VPGSAKETLSKYLAPDLGSPPSRGITCIAHTRCDMQEYDRPLSSLSIDSWFTHCPAGCAAICPRCPADGIIRLFPLAPSLSLKTGERPVLSGTVLFPSKESTHTNRPGSSLEMYSLSRDELHASHLILPSLYDISIRIHRRRLTV